MSLGGAGRGDLGDRSHAPAEQVDVVDALVHQRPAVHGVGATPRRAVVVSLAAVPLGAGLTEHQAAQGGLVEQALGLDEPGVETVLRDHRQGDACRPRRLDEPVSGLQRDIDRLLDDKMLARLRGADADLRVQAARHAHRHHLDVRAGEQGVQIGLGHAAARRGEGPGPGLHDVGDRHQPGVRQLGEGVGVDRRDHPGPDDPETTGHKASLSRQLASTHEAVLGAGAGRPRAARSRDASASPTRPRSSAGNRRPRAGRASP